jgi:hypothetical protein
MNDRSAGRTVDWDGGSYTIEELTEQSFGDVDIALFSAGGSISKKFAPIASDAGCTVRAAALLLEDSCFSCASLYSSSHRTYSQHEIPMFLFVISVAIWN